MSLSKILEVFVISTNIYCCSFILHRLPFSMQYSRLVFLFIYINIYICVYILDVICFVMVLVLCVVDPLPLRPGACCITRIQHREPKSMFLFLFYSHAVYSLSLDPFGFWLFTAIHAWKRNALYSPSQCQSSARHWNECLVEAKKNKTLKKKKDADVGKRFCFSSRSTLECKQIFQVFCFSGDECIFFSFYNSPTPVLQKKKATARLSDKDHVLHCEHLISSLSGRRISLQRQQQHNTTLVNSSRSTKWDTDYVIHMAT